MEFLFDNNMTLDYLCCLHVPAIAAMIYFPTEQVPVFDLTNAFSPLFRVDKSLNTMSF